MYLSPCMYLAISLSILLPILPFPFMLHPFVSIMSSFHHLHLSSHCRVSVVLVQVELQLYLLSYYTSHVYLSFLYVTSFFPSSILPWSSDLLCPSTENNHDLYNYGTTKALIVQGQSKARKRVFLFLSVFIIAGFFSKLAHWCHCYRHLLYS